MIQHLFHLLSKIVAKIEGLVIDIDIRVSGDTEADVLFYGVIGKYLLKMVQDDLLRSYISDLFILQIDNRRQNGRYGNYAEHFLFLVTEHRADMYGLV